MNKATIAMIGLIIITMLVLSAMVGVTYEQNRILKMCSEQHHEVYNNKSILRCQVIDIDEILTKNYWE